MQMYEAFPDKTKFFNDKNFDTHMGTSKLREQIKQGMTEQQIKETWKAGLASYATIRNKYLLYP
jgi:uncharacterized protein YbbC (DUF1343 family)